MPNRLEKAVRDHQNAIKAIDRAALGNVLQQYQAIAERLNPQIELLVQDIAGQDFASLSQLLRVTRMQELQRQFRVEMDELARQTGIVTDIGAGRAVDQAIDGAQAVTEASIAGNPATLMTSYNRISPQSVNAFIGATREGPLQELLASFGETVEKALIETLTDGIALGTNPRGIANMITRASEIGRNRALTIARTEVLRAHRTATLQQYQANADILKGWIWLSAKQTRTCAACLAMDGTFHELDETMASHPNCRCTMRPALKNDPMRKVQTGKQWLDKQPPEAQDAVLGKAGGAAYRAGEVELQDFVKVTESKDWGRTTTDGGVGFARMNAARRVEAAKFTAPKQVGKAKSSVDPFRPVINSRKDAETYFKSIGVEIDGLGGNKEMWQRVANGYADELSIGSQVPPKIKFKAEKSRTGLASYTRSNDATTGELRDEFITISTKSKFWDNPEKTLSELKASGFFSSDDPNHPIIHEFGHYLHAKIFTEDRWGHTFTVNGRTFSQRSFDEPGSSATAKKVSRYGATSPHEFVAETYAALRSGIVFDDDVMDLYRLYGGPEVKLPEDRKRKAS